MSKVRPEACPGGEELGLAGVQVRSSRGAGKDPGATGACPGTEGQFCRRADTAGALGPGSKISSIKSLSIEIQGSNFLSLS